MCKQCQDEWLRWLDYQPRQPIQIVNHATYDSTVRGVRDNRMARANGTADTIRFQQGLIKDQCKKASHLSD